MLKTIERAIMTLETTRLPMKVFREFHSVCQHIVHMPLPSDNLHNIIFEEIRNLIDCDGISLCLSHEITAGRKHVHNQGIETQADLAFLDELRGNVGQSREPAYMPDISSNLLITPGTRRHYLKNETVLPAGETGSLYASPLQTPEAVLGVVVVFRQRPDAFSEEERLLLDIFAGYAAIAIKNHQRFEEMEKLLLLDPLTKLGNRRMLKKNLESEILRARRYKHGLAVIFVDLDNFKVYNDTYGHLAGDVRLIGLARTLQENIRSHDCVARYGGEEFVLTISCVDPDEAMITAERIREAARQTAPHLKGDVVPGYTLSIGVAMLDEHGATGDELLAAADAAMLDAKQSGKNRIRRASGNGKHQAH